MFQPEVRKLQSEHDSNSYVIFGKKPKPVLLCGPANNSWAVIYKESRPKRLPASNQNPPLMQNKSCRRRRCFSNSKYLQLPLILNLWSVAPQLTDTWPFPLEMSVLWWLPSAMPLPSPSQLVKEVWSPPVPPARLASFVQALLQLLLLQFWLWSYYSVTNWRVKTFIQVYTVNFHSLRWNILVEFIPCLFLKYKWEKYIAIYGIQENCWKRQRFFLILIPITLIFYLNTISYIHSSFDA